MSAQPKPRDEVVKIDASQLGQELLEMKADLRDIREALAKLADLITVKRGKTRVSRAQYDRERHAFVMRQARVAKKLGFTREEFVARFGNIDHAPIGALSKGAEQQQKRKR